MPKTIHTPRDELICGKIDKAIILARHYQDVALIGLLSDIAHDAERMEAKLVSRKEQVERLQDEKRNRNASGINAGNMRTI